MKIIKIFGAVAAVHGMAFLLILAIPGCTTSSAPPPTAETVLGPSSNVPTGTNADFSQPVATPAPVPAASVASAPLPDFDPNAPAISGMERYRPNRPTDEPVAAPAEPAAPATNPDVTPATTYTVVSGDNLWTIARRNGLTAAELAAANSIPVNAIIRTGQRLIIPNRTEAAAAPAGPTYVVKANETLSGIAQRAGLTAAQLRSLNNLSSDNLRVGQELALPPGTTVASADVATGGNSYVHVVASGESLSEIARRYDVTVGEIATANNIADPGMIRSGSRLIIPGWQAAAAPAPTAGTAPAAAPSGNAAPAAPAPAAEDVPVIQIDVPVIPIQ